MDVQRTMFALIAVELCGRRIDDEIQKGITADGIPALYAISKSHDMAHIVGQALGKMDKLGTDEASAKFQKQQMVAIFRYERINYELGEICRVLEAASIKFIPLKGSVLRKYYPEPWMRTSCDIDILVHEDDLEKATDVIVDKLNYKNEGKSSHDVSMFSESGVHLELHYGTVEEGRAAEASEILADIWSYAIPAEGCAYHHLLSDEMFYFYHIAHMAKHFENGGCGIRPILDLWILEHCVPHDNKNRDRLLEESKLLKFTQVVRDLAQVWFSGEEHTEITRQTEQYIINGGVYGNMGNRVAVQSTKRGGRFRYAMSKIFLPYNSIKFHYPILEKHKWLLPFMEIRRWFKLIFCGHAKRSLNELKYNQTISADKADATKKFLENIGL